MRLFTLICGALLYFPAIVKADLGLGPATQKLVRDFSTEDELVYIGIISKDCDFLGFNSSSHDEILKKQLRLRRIKPKRS